MIAGTICARPFMRPSLECCDAGHGSYAPRLKPKRYPVGLWRRNLSSFIVVRVSRFNVQRAKYESLKERMNDAASAIERMIACAIKAKGVQ